MIKTLLQMVGAVAALMPLSGLAWAQAKYNLQEPATEIARQMYDLHTIVLVICLVIFVGVFGTMFYSMIKHRKSVGHQAAHFHENTTVEIMWTVVPFFILIGMAFPATQALLAMKDTSSPDMTIKVTGYQWKWGYEYLKGEGDLSGVADGVQFYSTLSTPRAQIYGSEPKGEHYLLEVDKPLVVPVGKKVRVLITANDVLHAWWVPAFGGQAGRHSGLHPRCLVQGRQGRDLPRPVRGAVRQGTRFHADRGSGAGTERVRRLGCQTKDRSGCGRRDNGRRGRRRRTDRQVGAGTRFSPRNIRKVIEEKQP